MDLEDVADELYGLPPDQFTAERNRRVQEAKTRGNDSLAGEIKGLRRPTTGAWAVNLLVRERPDLLAELLRLGDEMRTAQSELAGTRLRELAKQRHQLVAEMSSEGTRLAERSGRPLSNAAVVELEATLEAGIADTTAAEALRAGTLAEALSHTGFGGLDISQNTARPNPSARGANAGSRASEALALAQGAVTAASSQMRAAERRRDRAEEEFERRHKALLEGKKRVTVLRRAEDKARADLKAAKQEASAADRRLRTAQKRLDDYKH